MLVPAILLTGFSMFVLGGCEEDPAGPSDADIVAAEALVEDGMALLAAAMENMDPQSGTAADFSAPKQKFEDALELDPENDDARFGLALCEIGALTQDATLMAAIGGLIGDTPPFGRALPGSSGPGMGRALGGVTDPASGLLTPEGWLDYMQGRMMRTFQEEPPPDLGPLQDAVETVVIPVVEAVIGLLTIIESDPAWALVLTPTMQGFSFLPDQLEIDVTDVLLVDAFMHLLKAQLCFFVSYNLNVPDFYSTTSVQAALNQDDGTFLALRTNGAVNMGKVRQALIGAIGKVGNFMLSLEAETDNQDDDLIKTNDLPETGDDFETTVGKLLLALNGDFLVTDVDRDGDGTNDPFTVNLSDIFTSPVADLKDLLPPYSWDDTYSFFFWDGYMEQDLSQWVFPDPTMGGIFPDLTTDAAFKAFFGIPTDYWITPGPFPFGGGD